MRIKNLTSKEMDNDMYRRDIQLFLALNPIFEERQSKIRTYETAKSMFGDKK